MQINFKTKKLEKSLTDALAMRKTYGELAKKLSQRMEQLHAAPNLAHMFTIPGADCHPLIGNRKGEWAVRISGNYRLIFEIDQDPIPERPDGSVNTILVTHICILETADYH
jgi:proteic killer suppression protein